MSHMLHLSPWSRLPLNVCWFIEKYKRPLVPVPPPHVEVHLDFINCSKEQAEASSQEDEFFAEEEEDSIPSQEEDQKDEDSDDDDDAGSDDSFQALVNNYRKRPQTPKKSSPVKKQILQRLTNMNCILCEEEIDKSVSLACKDEDCQSQFHALCISKRCLSDENASSTFQNIIPVKFVCPTCGTSSSWGEYIRSVRCFNTAIVENPKESPFLGATCVKRIVSQSQQQKL